MLVPEKEDCPDPDSKIALGGMLTTTVNKITKAGKPMGTAILEDLYGSVELVAFNKTYEKLRPLWVKDTVVAVEGTVKYGDNGVSIFVDDITPFTDADAEVKKLCCYFSLAGTSTLDEVREIVSAYSGKDFVYVKNTDDGKLYRLSDKFSVETLSVSELCALLGEENVKIN